jgi:monoamine oxidase
VRRIAQTASGVDITADGATVAARRAIVATPPFVAGRIQYEPMLPPVHTQLFSRLQSGAAIRGITIFDEPFWRSEGLSGFSVAPDLPVPVALDQSPKSLNVGILSSYMFGPQALTATTMDPSERRSVWLEALAKRYGKKALTPRAHLETNWTTEEWSLGGMIAHYPPGTLTNYGSAIREPAGRIHFAGTERATEMYGLMEGAVRSGEKAADEVIAGG